MFLKDVTEHTTAPVVNHNAGIVELYLLTSGTGTVFVEQLGGGGEWQRAPELTFEGANAAIVSLRKGSWRVVVSGGPMTVELR